MSRQLMTGTVLRTYEVAPANRVHASRFPASSRSVRLVSGHEKALAATQSGADFSWVPAVASTVDSEDPAAAEDNLDQDAGTLSPATPDAAAVAPDAGTAAPDAGTLTPDAGVGAPSSTPDAGTVTPGAGPGGSAGAPPTVTVVVPSHIRGSHTPSAMPDRIPPRVDTPVAVTVSGVMPGSRPVVVTVDGAGGGNGTVSVDGKNDAVIHSSATVKLRGIDQTSPGNAGKLRLAAYHARKRLAASLGFSVAAIPQNFSIAFNSLVTGAVRGIKVNNNWESDSTAPADLDQVKRSEQVQYGAGTGVFVGYSGHNSGYLPADSPPTVDTHSTRVALLSGAGGAGAVNASQTFIFKDARTGVTDIPVRKSGFILHRALAVPLPPAPRMFTISKTGTATTANGFSSAAGAGSVSRNQPV
jgi:hypothetical protein